MILQSKLSLSVELPTSKQNLNIQQCYSFVCVIFNTSVLKILFCLQDLLVLEEQEVNVNLPPTSSQTCSANIALYFKYLH